MDFKMANIRSAIDNWPSRSISGIRINQACSSIQFPVLICIRDPENP